MICTFIALIISDYLKEYGIILKEFQEKMIVLQKEEKLFDVPPTDFSVLLNIIEEYEKMKMVYELYETQRDVRNKWAQILWVNLNPQQLINEMGLFLKEFRKLPQEVRDLDIAKTLNKNMRDFKNSVPLFVELKNEAIKERHWKDLMKKTGIEFDMTPDRFLQKFPIIIFIKI